MIREGTPLFSGYCFLCRRWTEDGLLRPQGAENILICEECEELPVPILARDEDE